MPELFSTVRFHAAEKTAAELGGVRSREIALRGVDAAKPSPVSAETFDSDEAAARFYCGVVFANDQRSGVRGLAAAGRPEAVPELRLRHIQAKSPTRTRLVQFDQTASAVPLFGSNVVVELGDRRELVSLTGEIGEVRTVSPLASVPPDKALAVVARLGQVDPKTLHVDAPKLTFFPDTASGEWHLAWHFRKVPVAPSLPTTSTPPRRGHGLGRSPRDLRPVFDYLVDAHDGSILFSFSAKARSGIVRCKGLDELGRRRDFYGAPLGGQNGFEMYDTLMGLRTFDLGKKDMDATPLPARACSSPAFDWDVSNTAAVSAHCNAQHVSLFYKSILGRDSIDDKGMELVSVVNCIYAEDGPGPEWHNAVWYDNRMWYGQTRAGAHFQSYSRYLDIIAHELTHGVTEHTADLVYRDESGALNESFSDIFGVIIANWDPARPSADVSTWRWEIGPGLGVEGGPLRDLSRPQRTNDPDHMDQYLVTEDDDGGVHTNSNIHNKAAFNVLTARTQDGSYLFEPKDVAVLYYLALQRLGRLATFKKALAALLDVATTFYGDPTDRAERVAAIGEAYRSVGIA